MERKKLVLAKFLELEFYYSEFLDKYGEKVEDWYIFNKLADIGQEISVLRKEFEESID